MKLLNKIFISSTNIKILIIVALNSIYYKSLDIINQS